MNTGNLGMELLLQLILIALNAVFACAEIAVISMNDNKLAKMAAEGDKQAVRLARLTSQPARFLATIQVAITLSGFLGSAFASGNFSARLVAWLVKLGVGVPEHTLQTVSVILITLILSYVTLVLGELVPKRVAMRKAESLALGMSAMISFISKVFAPVVWLLTASTNGILRLLGIDPDAEDETVTEEEIRMMVDVGSEKGAIDPDEKALIQNVFEFDDICAEDIATHRMEVSLLWMDESPEQWEKTIHESRHTMYPVCDETVDNVVGVLNAKDYFRLEDKGRDSVLSIIKPAYFVPSNVKADVLFRNMKRTRNRFAVVLDNYGGMQGVVTINDLIEQLVGDLEDEDDDQEPEDELERIDSTTWRAGGDVELAELGEKLGLTLPSEDYETLGELIFGTLGAIPADGSNFELDIAGLHIKVAEIGDHRVKKALICADTATAAQAREENVPTEV